MKVFKFWINLFSEIKLFYKFRKATYSIREELQEANMRVDWLGRVYTVINLKEELLNQNEYVKQGWVLQQLGGINEILMKYGLSDVSYPEISNIKDEPGAYLLVIWPEYEYLRFDRVIFNVVFLIAVLYSYFLSRPIIDWCIAYIRCNFNI